MSELEPTRTYSNPTATEVLRRLLDERGVEWWQKKRHTCWKVSKGQEVEMWRAWEAPDGSLTLKVDYIYGLTPEQAIAATLGPCNCPDNCTNGERTGTCHDKGTFNSWGLFTCSNCSVVFPLDAVKDAPSIGRTLLPKYCPNCGRKVVSNG